MDRNNALTCLSNKKENIKKSYSMAKKMKAKAETEMDKKFVKKDDFYY